MLASLFYFGFFGGVFGGGGGVVDFLFFETKKITCPQKNDFYDVLI